jgi:hypothetical protein
MKALRKTWRKFLWEMFHGQLQYHPYTSGSAAGYAGWYTLWGMTVAFDDIGENHRQPYFGW